MLSEKMRLTAFEKNGMITVQRAIAQGLLLLLSLLGAGIAIYLTAVHYEHVPLVCSTSGVIDCARVLSSSYSVIPGTEIPITVPGLGWCAIIAALAIVGLRQAAEQRWLHRAEFACSLLGMLVVLYLVYVELVRIHSICIWCTALHVVILLTFLITVVQLQQPEPEPEAEEMEKSAVPTKSP